MNGWSYFQVEILKIRREILSCKTKC